MKKLTYILLFFVAFANAQNYSTVPMGISYQGVARKADGSILSNTIIAVRFKILPVGGGGPLYVEEYTGSTGLNCNMAGIFTATIGSVYPGTFKTINWATDKYEIQVEIDITNSISWFYVGTQPFKSVPYAFHSADGLIWKGNYTTVPTATLAGSAYRNRSNGVTYYSNGSVWDTLAYTNTNSIKPFFNQTISTAYTINSGTLTPIPFNAVTYSSVGGALSLSGFTVTSSGLYHIDAAINVSISVALATYPFDYQLQIMVGGGTQKMSHLNCTSGTVNIQNKINADVYLNSGDILQIGIWHNSGPSSYLTIMGGPAANYFNCHKIN